MTRGTSTTTEWISASSDLMDAGSNDCALATVVVQTDTAYEPKWE